MVLLIAIGAAAAAYASNRSKDGSHDAGPPKAEPLDRSILDNKRGVDFLPLEQTLALFAAPIATVTFMDGDPAAATEYLRQRVTEIVQKNPWLGGWLARDKGSGGAVRLFYDEAGTEYNVGLFQSFDTASISLTRDTPYEEYGELFSGQDVMVRCNADIIDKQEPLWRVSVIPDADSPQERFALVVSMSHMVGDGFTFFKIFHQLATGASIEAMDPVRRPHEYTEQVCQLLGRDEVFYINKITKSPVWAAFRKDETVIEHRVFYLDEEWIKSQKEAWDTVGRAEMRAHHGAGDSGAASARPKRDFKVSFAAHQASPSLSTNDIVTSWFFKIVDATVGLMPYNVRNKLAGVTELDAGNYTVTLPYNTKHFDSPLLIHSRLVLKQARHEDPLPDHSMDNRYCISVDWRSFQREGGLTIGHEGECRQVLQLPCYYAQDLKSIPKTFSFIHLFNAGPNGEPAVEVIAPRTVMEKVASSGMVKTTIAAIDGDDNDEFVETVQETLQGRRESVYAKFLDSESLAPLIEGEYDADE